VGPFIFSLFLIMNPSDLTRELPRGFYPSEEVTELHIFDRGVYPAAMPLEISEYCRTN
jgi:hypothetical protein